jgi:RHS repeat-associated protein
VNPANKKITYTLDAFSRRTRMIEPGGGRFTYGYDDADRIAQLINPQAQRTSWNYDNANRTLCNRLANTNRASYSYDDADQILRVANVIPGTTTLSSFGYKYDPAGNRLRVIEANGDTVTWSYDKTYQLTNEKRSGTNSYNVTYLYDPAGNRLRKTDSSTISTTIYDAANQIIKANAAGTITTYLFDANGNQQRTTASVVTTYTWDFENRLTKIRQGSATPLINTMAYDGDGKRVRKDDSVGTFKQIWDGSRILEETDQNDLIVGLYTMKPDLFGNLVSQLRASTSSFYLFDAMGSTDRLTDINGQASTDTYIYRGFGDIQSSTGTTTNPFRYVGCLGYYYDLDFLHFHLRARYYDPVTGRFKSRDPLPLAFTTNLFVYTKNSPIIHSDPSGLLTSDEIRKKCKDSKPLSKKDPKACKYGNKVRYCADFVIDNDCKVSRQGLVAYTLGQLTDKQNQCVRRFSWPVDCVCKNASDDELEMCLRGCLQCWFDISGTFPNQQDHHWCVLKCCGGLLLCALLFEGGVFGLIKQCTSDEGCYVSKPTGKNPDLCTDKCSDCEKPNCANCPKDFTSPI